MSLPTNAERGIFSLPNEVNYLNVASLTQMTPLTRPELLYTILEPLTTSVVLTISPTSRRVHALCVRLLHNRLSLASSLAQHVLYLEAYPPSAKLTAGGLYCASLGTPHLESVLESPDDAGKIGRLGTLYSVFRPQRTEPRKRTSRRPGDIPGSRTFADPDPAQPPSRNDREKPDSIGETVSLDAHELFAQLCAVIHMVKIGRQNQFTQLVEVCDGTIRVWRDWLKEQAEAKTQAGSPDYSIVTQDQRILWVNKGKHTVGIRCSVKEKKWASANPVLVSNEDDIAVSYYVEFEGGLCHSYC